MYRSLQHDSQMEDDCAWFLFLRPGDQRLGSESSSCPTRKYGRAFDFYYYSDLALLLFFFFLGPLPVGRRTRARSIAEEVL